MQINNIALATFIQVVFVGEQYVYIKVGHIYTWHTGYGM